MRSHRRIGTALDSAARTRAEGVPRRLVGSRLVNGRSDALVSKDVDKGNGGPRKPDKTLAARYLDVERLRKQVLEAESQRNSW
jgi:hypothetical protein